MGKSFTRPSAVKATRLYDIPFIMPSSTRGMHLPVAFPHQQILSSLPPLERRTYVRCLNSDIAFQTLHDSDMSCPKSGGKHDLWVLSQKNPALDPPALIVVKRLRLSQKKFQAPYCLPSALTYFISTVRYIIHIIYILESRKRQERNPPKQADEVADPSQFGKCSHSLCYTNKATFSMYIVSKL